MKNAKTIFVTAAIVTALAAVTIGAVGSNYSAEKTVTYRDIKITLDGQQITPKDANGNPVEPFIIDGTTYLPVRGVADALGLSVDWDGETSTVILASSAPAASSTTIKAGMYLVGRDIPAGTYKLTADNESGYWERLSDASGSFDAIIANDFFTGNSFVTVNNGEYLKIEYCTGVLQ